MCANKKSQSENRPAPINLMKSRIENKPAPIYPMSTKVVILYTQ